MVTGTFRTPTNKTSSEIFTKSLWEKEFQKTKSLILISLEILMKKKSGEDKAAGYKEYFRICVGKKRMT